MAVVVVIFVRTPILRCAAPNLDQLQRSVVDHHVGPLLVLAGPGTGKTATLVESIVAQLRGHQGRPAVNPDRLLALTFGRRAASELHDRVAARLGGGAMPTISTFHSFCYGLVRQLGDTAGALHPPRLLSAPEQDRRVRELLVGSVRDGRVRLPAELQAALGTRGLGAEVRAVIARAQGLALTGTDLVELGQAADQPGWVAVGEFLGEYLDVLDAEGVMDYSELIHRASELIDSELIDTAGAGAAVRDRYDVVFVDEYQDTDPSQVRLLRRIVRVGATFVAVGDPDQAIYGFRGADVGGILRFRDDFCGPHGAPPEVIVLNQTHRFGPAIRDAAARVIRRVPLGALPREIQQRHRSTQCVSDSAQRGAVDDGSVEVTIYESVSAQAIGIADLVRRTKLRSDERALRWSDIAILVRSGTSDINPIQRALEAVDVPVQVSGDEIPLRSQPSVQPLLAALRIAADTHQLTEDRAVALLASPLGGLDGQEMRRLGRQLRNVARAAGELPSPSSLAIRDAIADPRLLLDLPESTTVAPQRVADLLRKASAAVAGGESVEQVLWMIWDSTSWPARLRKTALAGGTTGRAAHRDLDAVVALFDTAARTDAIFHGRKGVVDFLAELDHQVIPGTTFTEHGAHRDAVRLMTAHRSKGLQWPVVVVAGVQEGQWPDLRRRGTLLRLAELRPAELGAGGLEPAMGIADVLAEERRLFYVACTRAQRKLIVTAVQSPSDRGVQPSRFIDEVAGNAIEQQQVNGYPTRRLTLVSIIAELRHTLQDPASSDGMRNAAAGRLARLASDEDTPRCAAANPCEWWGVRDRTVNELPIRSAETPLNMSGTAWSSITECSLRWFLSREARGEGRRGSAVAFGSVVHALADAVARGEIAADAGELKGKLHEIWGALPFESSWQSSTELTEAQSAVTRFLQWHCAENMPQRAGRTNVGTEVRFDIELDVATDVATDRIKARGAVDRLETDEAGAVHIIDLKTMRNEPSAAQVAQHKQLALYQVVTAAGAFDEQLGVASIAERPGDPPAGSDRPSVGGAELVQLRKSVGRTQTPKVQAQSPVDPLDVVAQLGTAVRTVRTEQFSATPGDHCGFCDFLSMCPAKAEGAAVTL